MCLSTPRPSPASPKVAQKIPNSKSRLIGFPPDEAFLNLASTTCWGQLSVGHEISVQKPLSDQPGHDVAHLVYGVHLADVVSPREGVDVTL